MANDVKWIKLDVGIFEDEKIRIILSMPEGKSMLIIWLKLLCLAGRINNSGVLMVNRTIPYTVEMLASVFNEPEPIMRITIDTFSKLDMVEQFNGTLLLPNWEKHQSEDKLKEIQRKSADRVSRHRANQRLVTGGNVTETLHVTLPKRICNADVTQSLSKNKNLEQELRTKNIESTFNTFWNEYPKKVAKATAYKAWAKVDPKLYDTIMVALTTQKASEDWTKENGKFIPHPTTWLNQQRWEDELSCGLPKRKEKILSD